MIALESDDPIALHLLICCDHIAYHTWMDFCFQASRDFRGHALEEIDWEKSSNGSSLEGFSRAQTMDKVQNVHLL